MTSSKRPAFQMDLGNVPSIVPNPGSPARSIVSPVASPGPRTRLQAAGASLGGLGLTEIRNGAGSPSREAGSSRFYPRRTPGWGPPVVSGLSTPLRGLIPESPNDENDPFPNLGEPTPSHEKPMPSFTSANLATARRARAGTAPSRAPPGLGPPAAAGLDPGPQAMAGSRADMSGSPFRPSSASLAEMAAAASTSPASAAAVLSRIRAGSTPQRTSLLSAQTPFGGGVFSTSYNRGRASTLSGLLPDSPSSPPALGNRKDSLKDTDIRTLDYLGLVDPSPVSATASNAGSDAANLLDLGRRPMMASQRVPSSRFRSYSVNAKEKYAMDEEEDLGQASYYSGTLTPSAEAAAQALAITQAQIRQHNLDVQAFAHAAAASRPRAQTTGLLDSPSSRMWQAYNQQQVGFDDEDEEVAAAGDLVDRMQDAVQALAIQDQLVAAQVSVGLDNRMLYEDATRALWLGNIPPSTTPSTLKQIFETYGKIESARVLTHKGCGFINYETVESALQAKAALDGKEIFPGAGAIKINYAKVQSAIGTPAADGYFPSPSPAPQLGRGALSAAPVTALEITEPLSGLNDNMALPPVASLQDMRDEILKIVGIFGATEAEVANISSSVEQALQNDKYEMEIPAIPESTQGRMHDAPKLRDIRKRIDNDQCTSQEIEEMAFAMLPEVTELASDYLGNTVVQKLFDFCGEATKERMLAEIGPHIAEIGVHKNGTWAAQRIIEVARTPNQMNMIVDGLRPYSVASFLDQYGNYVMQGCLGFGVPYNNFIFEAMLTRLWDISQGRFGARSMRACLESHKASKEQQRMLAAAIALNSVRLATNANGALLLTWYLDTCTFPGRRQVLAPLLIPHLTELCTHKVAYLTVLKIINQRNEPAARDTILDAIFFSPEDKVLTEVLKDQACGATLVFKILTTPFFEETKRADAVQKIRAILLELKVQPSQGYKRLLDEVGLAARSAGPVTSTTAGPASALRDSLGAVSAATGSSESGASRPTSKAGIPVDAPLQQGNGGYFPTMPVPHPTASPFNPSASLNGFHHNAANAAPFEPFASAGAPRHNGPMRYGGNRGVPNLPPQMYQMGYQQPPTADVYRAVMAQQVARGQFPPGMGMHGMQHGPPPPVPPMGIDPQILHMWAQQQGYAMPGQSQGGYYGHGGGRR